MDVPGYDDKLPPIWTMGVGHIRTVADARAHMDGYDTGIRYADHYVGKLIDDLKRLGIYDDTVIIVSADHGENQGELNIWGDHQTADHITNRVPLIVRWPGVTDGQAGGVRDAPALSPRPAGDAGRPLGRHAARGMGRRQLRP